MKYPLQALGPDRFQQLCQALLAKAFPGTHLFPVGEPDGGRDAVLQVGEDDTFIVFQIKYWTGKSPGKPARTWLIDTLTAESPKIARLIPRGASRFVLLTNAFASGALELGSSDTVASLLRSHLPIPATCWWRDDIERHLDDAWNVKWAFPEVLSNYDIIRMLLEREDPSNASTRALAVKAALRDQFDKEKDVRFRQVDLTNDLLDLFVDVPVTIPEVTEPSGPRRTRVSVVQELAFRHTDFHETPQPTLGAASLLLDALCQSQVKRIVLEGAPGQGKSTIAQYICQIHRHHLLDKALGDERIPANHKRQPARIPFKIDCRDMDTWLQGDYPFPMPNGAKLNGPRSLETFLCAQILHHSGGSPFSVADLHALLRYSAIFLAFDGLDEVADVARRGEVVEHIWRGVSRLEEVALSVQTLVTSRPAVFANSPSFPRDKYLYLSLTSITRPIIHQYADGWLTARNLDQREASEVRRILATKLDQPHMAELARNPMQLAILLSLIHTRGVSLPDKRTALYDSYVDLFFAREAEKSGVVRDNRDLLVDIHQYLGWVLHSEAQTHSTHGRVTDARLRKVVAQYLRDEGRDVQLADKLFSGIAERVVALVSRVEGTYEFEVQPLREYFAARHLYDTAPYSPAGQERTGTLPERFDALSRDSFWQNVTRFYAGCYSRGQLPSLVQSLKELRENPHFSRTGYPQELAAALLSDWTLAQYPKLMREVISFVVREASIRYVTSRDHFRVRSSALLLPWQCGGEELVDRCFSDLARDVPDDYARLLLACLRDNCGTQVAFEKWRHGLDGLSGKAAIRWLSYGLFLGLLDRLVEDDVKSLLNRRSLGGNGLLLLERGGALGRSIRAHELKGALRPMLEGEPNWVFPYSDDGSFRRLQRALSPRSFELLFHFGKTQTLSELWDQRFTGVGRTGRAPVRTALPNSGLARRCHQYTRKVEELARRFSIASWRTNLEPWSALVESGRRAFGSAWVFYVLAFTASAVKAGRGSDDDASSLFNDDSDLCQRARYARQRAGNAGWWKEQIALAADWESRTFALLLFFAWAGPRTLRRAGAIANDVLTRLPDEWWSRLHKALRGPLQYAGSTASKASDLGVESIPPGVGARFVTLISRRLKRRAVSDVYHHHLRDYDGSDRAVLGLCLEAALQCAVDQGVSWSEWLEVVAEHYRKGASFGGHLRPWSIRGELESGRLDFESAKRIVTRCEEFPLILVGVAEQVCRSAAVERVQPVGKIAHGEGWFRPGPES